MAPEHNRRREDQLTSKIKKWGAVTGAILTIVTAIVVAGSTVWVKKDVFEEKTEATESRVITLEKAVIGIKKDIHYQTEILQEIKEAVKK